jgi:hypothetical protein
MSLVISFDVSEVLWKLGMSLVINVDVNVVLWDLDMSVVLTFDVSAVLWDLGMSVVITFDVNAMDSVRGVELLKIASFVSCNSVVIFFSLVNNDVIF